MFYNNFVTIGFKTGPKNWEIAKRIVEEDGAKMCEVWFNVNKEKEYTEMFEWLGERNVQIGLHHWGVVDGKIKTNLATQDKPVREEGLRQMKRVVDIGRDIGAVYVNVHPGARWQEKIDLEKQEQALIPSSETPVEISSRILIETALELNNYSKTRGVLLTIETMLGREAKNYARREGIYDAGTPPLALMEELTQQGILIANDITHSAGAIAAADNSREGMWQKLFDFTKKTAPFTKLLHVNTMRPPFDGRDSHDGLLEDDFAQDFFPSRTQIIELLRIFADREDVFAVPEPQIEKTRENYRALLQLASEAGA